MGYSTACRQIKVLRSFQANALDATKEKGMEVRNIDKIDVKRDHKKLIALYYYLELKSLVQILMHKEVSRSPKYKP
jgi:hypothetical protein